jgi:hypothetical protein
MPVTSRARIVAALAAAIGAFVLFRATLLPGLDFGDTASLQVVAGLPNISTRDGYPLYFAIAALVVRVADGEPAHALNLTSAIESALACGVLSLVAAELSGSAVAGLASALLFAASYTLWSQSVVAEVYGLHLLCVGLTLWLLLRWEARPSLTRLGVFFAAYALGFGNHLAMILLAPAYTVFLLTSAPDGWRSMFTPRVIALAAVCAAAGALQYTWNLRSLWYAAYPPHSILDAIAAGWFDITKADWRETMVMNVPRELLKDHAAMYLFDLRQQFGWPGIALAAIGAIGLFTREWRRGLLVAGVYLANVLFAFGYNVGDTHVFYLPSHLVVALMTAPGIVLMARTLTRSIATNTRKHEDPAGLLAGMSRQKKGSYPFFAWGRFATKGYDSFFAVALLMYAGLRMYHDYPALDRSADRRPTEALDRLTAGLDDHRAILLTDLNWQVQNGLTYYGQRLHPEIAYTRMPEVLLYAPALVRDNLEIGREVVFTGKAHAGLVAAYGPLIPTDNDPRAPVAGLATLTADLPAGTRYVLCILKPARDFTLDGSDVSRAVAGLTGGTLTAWPTGDYVAVAGVAGRPATMVAAANRPFRQTIDLDGTPVEIRMDSWLAADTIRRMGFGHVIAGRRHTLIVERGASFAAFDRAGQPLRAGYAGGLFAPQPRYVCYP